MNLLRKYLTDQLTLLFSIAATFSWAYLIIIILNSNEYGFFSLPSLRWIALLSPFLLAAAIFLPRRFQVIPYRPVPARERNLAALISLAAALLIYLWFPFPRPALVTDQTLVLISTGEKQAASLGNVVEIREVRGYDNTEIPIEKFQLFGDWKIVKGSLVAEGKIPGARAEYHGPLAGGAVLRLRYNQDAGVLKVKLNNQEAFFDLYAEQGTTVPVQVGKPGWLHANLPQKAWLALNTAVILIALTSLGIIITIAARSPNRFISLLMISLYLGLFLVFLYLKLMYPQFNAERVFRDTYSYVAQAELPLWSKGFWVGQRTFTLPLLYKLLGLNLNNYTDREKLTAVAQAQMLFSIFAWTLLAASFSRTIRQVWLRLLAFGLVLFFSLSLEISFWDSLMLSESLSFSCFALTLSFWIMTSWLPARFIKGKGGYFYLLLTAVITILYTFTRETNLYFVLAGAVLFALLAVVRWVPTRLRRHFTLYAVFALGLFIFQNWTLHAGNRWQIHIYDHLALRILPDPEARAYFAAAGLPLDDSLMAITNMFGYQYHDLLDSDPSMADVRSWINQSGRATLLRYLLTHPAVLFWKPILEADDLLNGSNLEYRYPRRPLQPVPDFFDRLTARLYPHSPAVLWLMAVCILSLAAVSRLTKDKNESAWWLTLVILLTLYPLMIVTWNGNPLEVERHAAQIGIQLRLAGWMSLLMFLDWIFFCGYSFHRPSISLDDSQASRPIP